jgi:HK97 family phage prohead protease
MSRQDVIEIEARFLAARELAPTVQRCVECGGTCGGKNKDKDGAKTKRHSDVIDGYAATFGTRSQDLGGFVETLVRGAFSGVLKRAANGEPSNDVVALWNHDPNIILGRLSAGTLNLVEDERGLRYRIFTPDWARGYVETVERGDVTGSSFSFAVNKRNERWAPGEAGGVPLRSISEVERLVDVGPVVFPAYFSTESKVAGRALEMARQLRAASRSANTPTAGNALSAAALDRAVAALERMGRRNCGTGAGGFHTGNTCAKGGDGEGEPAGAKKKRSKSSIPLTPRR